MTDQERKAMEMALDYIKDIRDHCACEGIDCDKEDGLIEALRQALNVDAIDTSATCVDKNEKREHEPHLCELNSPDQAYGVAIDDCYEDDEGRFWAGNGEYGSQVNYCPVCGTKAPKQIDGDKHD